MTEIATGNEAASLTAIRNALDGPWKNLQESVRLAVVMLFTSIGAHHQQLPNLNSAASEFLSRAGDCIYS